MNLIIDGTEYKNVSKIFIDIEKSGILQIEHSSASTLGIGRIYKIVSDEIIDIPETSGIFYFASSQCIFMQNISTNII